MLICHSLGFDIRCFGWLDFQVICLCILVVDLVAYAIYASPVAFNFLPFRIAPYIRVVLFILYIRYLCHKTHMFLVHVLTIVHILLLLYIQINLLCICVPVVKFNRQHFSEWRYDLVNCWQFSLVQTMGQDCMIFVMWTTILSRISISLMPHHY